jgi:hypothetical protein
MSLNIFPACFFDKSGGKFLSPLDLRVPESPAFRYTQMEKTFLFSILLAQKLYQLPPQENEA